MRSCGLTGQLGSSLRDIDPPTLYDIYGSLVANEDLLCSSFHFGHPPELSEKCCSTPLLHVQRDRGLLHGLQPSDIWALH